MIALIYYVKNEFVKITETSATIQNTSCIYDVEISNKAEPNSGILLRPLNKFSFSDQTIYARCVDEGALVELRVVPFTVDMGAGNSSSGDSSGFDTFDQGDLDDIFKP